MPRPLRLEFEGAWYHVMNRGAGRQNIYFSNEDRCVFLKLLNEATLYYNIQIHAYCLMDNHYHLLIHTPQANLAQAMRHINGLYTQIFNRSHGIDGSLFRGRYKSILIDQDSYLLQVSRYIHLNPISANLTKYPEDYKWSSYQFYIERASSPSWLHIDYIQSMISKKNKRQEYQFFVNEGLDEETKIFYECKKHPVIFGSKKFKTKTLNSIPLQRINQSKPDYNRTRIIPSSSQISKACSNYFKINKDELFHYQLGKKNMPRKIAMYLCKSSGQMKLEDISSFFKCKTKSGAANAVSFIKKGLNEDISLKRKINQIVKILKEKQ